MIEELLTSGTEQYRFLTQWPSEFRRIVIVDRAARAGSVSDLCREAAASLSSGSFLAVAIHLPRRGRFRKLVATLALPARMTAAERALARCGAVGIRRYGVIPNVEEPTLLYPIGTPAGGYAETHLIPASGGRPRSTLRHVLKLWIGCDPAIGSVLVVGRKA